MVPLIVREQRLADRYALERELTIDDEATDWLAHDTALDRRVVLRLLHAELAADAGATEHFWQTARAAARAGAADQPRILDGGTDAATGQVFIVREWRDESVPADAPSAHRPAPRVTPGVTPHVTPGVVADAGVTPRVTRAVTPGGGEVASGGVTWRRAGGRALPGWPLSLGHLAVLGLVVALAVGGWLVGAGAQAWLAWVNEPLGRPAQNVTLAPAVGAPAGQATHAAGTLAAAPRTLPPTLAAAPRQNSVDTTPVPTATDTREAGEPRRVVNTDGQGVALRVSPGGDRQPGQGYPEGALVTVFEQQGAWARIRGADGREGWVLAVTLAPTAGAGPASAPAPPSGTPAPLPAGPAVPALGSTPVPAGVPAAPTPAAAASGRQRVARTDGLGVALRSAPNGDRLPGRGYAEGTTVTVLERSGAWTHIRGDDGRDGWVPTVTLAP
ncbi:MAG TPA: SH3 domain-containing protein [Chloroflexota bacterium]|nr:SH3 domain-containing protein [Chloroflexota bacterium]